MSTPTLERRAKRVALAVALLMVPAALVFLMRDGLVARFLDVPPTTAREPSVETGAAPSLLAPRKDGWSRVTIKETPEEAQAAAAANKAPAAPSAQAPVKAVEAPKDAIYVRPATKPVPIGKSARE